jgi:nucleotide-binding universal stress UspA family protein
VLATARKLDCDLIVMTSHRPELKDYLLGPNAARVMRHAKQSVFIVRE